MNEQLVTKQSNESSTAPHSIKPRIAVNNGIPCGASYRIRKQWDRSNKSGVMLGKSLSLDSAETMRSDANKKRVQFNFVSIDEEDFEEDEEKVNPCPATKTNGTFLELLNQEPRSAIKEYIESDMPTTSLQRGSTFGKSRIVRQKSIDGQALHHEEYKAQPIMLHCEKGSKPSIPVKETVASKKRYEKLREENLAKLEKLEKEEQYMPPLQRKELTIKELNRQLVEVNEIVESRTKELEAMSSNREKEIQDVVSVEEEHIESLTDYLKDIKIKGETFNAELQKQRKKNEELLQEIEQGKVDMLLTEKSNQEVYLKMYERGKTSVSFCCDDEVEHEVIKSERTSDECIENLLKELETAESELEHWQNMKFESEDFVKTEANAMLRFIKDSMYHHLTDPKKESAELHLNALIGMFGFSESQMKLIRKEKLKRI